MLSREFLYLILASSSAGVFSFILIGMVLSLGRPAYQKRLDAFQGLPSRQAVHSQAGLGSPNYIIRLGFGRLGIDAAGWERLAVGLASAALTALPAGVIVILHLPIVLLLAAPLFGYLAVRAYLDSAWQAQALSLERELPVMLNRLASLLKARENVIECLLGVVEGLDADRPLKSWVADLADALHDSPGQALAEARKVAEPVSASLLLAVILIGRAWETGGSSYAEALRLASSSLNELLETRAQAAAVAAGAWSTARTILLALGFTLGAVLVNPVSQAAFQAPLIQGVMLAALIWAGLGYWNIRDAIARVTE